MLCKSEKEELYFHSPFEVIRMTFNKNQKTHIILLPDIVKLCFVIIDIASSLLRIVDIDADQQKRQFIRLCLFYSQSFKNVVKIPNSNDLAKLNG